MIKSIYFNYISPFFNDRELYLPLMQITFMVAVPIFAGLFIVLRTFSLKRSQNSLSFVQELIIGMSFIFLGLALGFFPPV